MKLPLYQVDAFTSRVFGGNPAAVVLLEQPLPEDVMQAIAAENNLSETAFVLPGKDGFGLRWFTPTMEVDLCGHATLATAFVLFREGRVRGDRARFETLSGPLLVERDAELLRMDFPARPPQPAAGSEELVEALGARPREVHAARDLLVLFDTQEQIAALRPRFDRMLALDAFAVIATAPGKDADFVSRFFAPKAGINEDPVTGAAHCTLIPFWSARLSRKTLRGLQISARGGELFCEDRGDRVTISGRAVEYLRGEIEVDVPRAQADGPGTAARRRAR
jgi:PhzF family phenazine biosynthesis protein